MGQPESPEPPLPAPRSGSSHGSRRNERWHCRRRWVQMGHLDQVCCWGPPLLEVLLPVLLLHLEGETRAQDTLEMGGGWGTGGHLHRGGFCPFLPNSCPAMGRRERGPLRPPSPGHTHCRQRKEGDAEQSKPGCQHPSQPRLRRFVPVTNGGQRHLRGERTRGALQGAPPPRPPPSLPPLSLPCPTTGNRRRWRTRRWCPSRPGRRGRRRR